jgi:hypothetical protein
MYIRSLFCQRVLVQTFEIWIFRNDQPDCDDDRRFFAYITLTEENAINHDVSHFSSLSISD